MVQVHPGPPKPPGGAFEPATQTLWVGEYESTFVTVIETQSWAGSDPTSA